MEQLIILGTGNALVTECYNTCFALQKGNEYFLVDAGGGNRILQQLKVAGVPLKQIHVAFVTHAHTDHIIGMVWIYRMIATLIKKQDYEGNFIIYCHDEAKHTLETMIDLMLPGKFKSLLGNRIFIQEVVDGESVDVLGHKLFFFDIGSTKMKQYGFYVELEKGRFVCLGDEPCGEHMEQTIQNAYFLMHEAFCLFDEREIFKPYEKHHSTAKDAGALAQRCHVKNLLLYHTEETHLDQRKELYRREASSQFSGTVYVPDDLEHISLV